MSDFYIPPKPSIVLSSESRGTYAALSEDLARQGVSRERRRAIVSEVRRVSGIQDVIEKEKQKRELRAFLVGLGVTALSGGGGGLLTAAYQVPRPLRFRASNSNYANLTPAAGTQDKWKVRVGLKRGTLGAQQCILSAASTSDDQIYFDSSDRLCWNFAGTNRLVSTSVYRDPAGWGTWEFIYDAANGTAALKARVFLNGVELTTWSTDTRSSITTGTSKINTNVVHNLGRRANGTTGYFDGYMSDFALIDNSATTLFGGSTSSTTGAYDPTAPSSALIWLKFADNSSVANLGTDSGSRAVAWTMNNFSITAGVTNDSLVDTPTNYGTDTGAGGEVRGNYPTLNPLDQGSAVTLTEGNLKFGASNDGEVRASVAIPSSGKWYFECTAIVSADTFQFTGVCNAAATLSSGTAALTSDYRGYRWNGNKVNGSGTAFGNSIAANNVVGVAVNMDAGEISFYKNGSLQGGGAAFTDLAGTTWFPFTGLAGTGTSNTTAMNFGQRPFANAAPSGFKALCTQNLATPAIAKPRSHFDVAIYTGNGGTNAVSTDGSVANNALLFTPDFVWIKGRSGATDHAVYDSVRGVQKRWETNNSDDDVTSDAGVTSFDAAGFSLSTLAQVNTNAATYVAWLAKGGGAAVTNNNGSMASQVSANLSAGISILTYTGQTAAGTIGHGLGVAPSMVIVKARTTAGANTDAAIYHTSLGNTNYLLLDSTAASATDTYWNNTSPTSSVFSVGTLKAPVNTLADTYVAYCFAEVAGFSKFGSYTGNAAANGPFVWCGFRPRFVLIKDASTTGDWFIYDSARDAYNVMADRLYTDTNAAEGTTSGIDLLSNGFKLRTITTDPNAAQTYIFAAFAETPFAYARAR